MNVICTRCGATDVTCEAVINPNTKVFKEYTGESFTYGYCNSCDNSTVLTDTDVVTEEIQVEYDNFIQERDEGPTVASCRITWKDDNGTEEVRISLLNDTGEEDDIFFYCQSLSGLKSLATFGCGDFIITEIYNFQ
nr:hypothetical protein [Bacteroides intestinalis]